MKVERQSASKKPFLGGYKHRISGIEYHNAAAQTLPKRKPDNGVRLIIIYTFHFKYLILCAAQIAKFQRDTQTVEVANRYQQATVDATTQMVGSHYNFVLDDLKQFSHSLRIRLDALLVTQETGLSPFCTSTRQQKTTMLGYWERYNILCIWHTQ